MVAPKPQKKLSIPFSVAPRNLIIIVPMVVAIIFSCLYLSGQRLTAVSQQEQESAPSRTSHLQQDTTQPIEQALPTTPSTTTAPSTTTTAPSVPQTTGTPPTSPQPQPAATAAPDTSVLQQLTSPVTQPLQSLCQPGIQLGGGMSNDTGHNALKCLL